MNGPSSLSVAVGMRLCSHFISTAARIVAFETGIAGGTVAKPDGNGIGNIPPNAPNFLFFITCSIGNVKDVIVSLLNV